MSATGQGFVGFWCSSPCPCVWVQLDERQGIYVLEEAFDGRRRPLFAFVIATAMAAGSNPNKFFERISTRVTGVVQRHQLCDVATVPFCRRWIVDGTRQAHDAVGVLNGVGAKQLYQRNVSGLYFCGGSAAIDP